MSNAIALIKKKREPRVVSRKGAGQATRYVLLTDDQALEIIQ